MNSIVITIVAAAIIGALVASRAHAQNSQSSGAAPTSKKNPADIGRELRRRALTAAPEEYGAKPTKEFPRVYAILMDLPIGDFVATVFSSSTGAASLYTTSTFGVIGGEFHERVRAAARAFVKAADRHVSAAVPTTEFPYPQEGRVRFYFVTFDGVRVIDTDLTTINSGTSKYSEWYELGQAVLTELRRVAEKRM
jgi:hypothetical protein